MPTVVVGTAGHIDHGKTTLLRAITGIDADRLPEERSRGLTIDVGYAHLDFDDGSSLDFVDVPGHDRYVGNMLVGAGEIDAALLVVAADDGPRPQTLEHLALLDALVVRDGIAVVTKADAVPEERANEVERLIRALIDRTTLAGSPVRVVSATTGAGMDDLLGDLRALRDRVAIRWQTRPAGPLRLALDRAFNVKGRGAVVTGSLRGGEVKPGDRLRLEPGGAIGRIRGLEVHHRSAERHKGGRTALNLAGVEPADLRRGQVLTKGAGIEASDRLLVRLAPIASLGDPDAELWPPADGALLRLHIGTDQIDAVVRRRGRRGLELGDGWIAAELDLAAPVATFVGDRAVLRRPSPGRPSAAVRVLDPSPPRGVARRRATPDRVAALGDAIDAGDAAAAADALVALHGAVRQSRIAAARGALRGPDQTEPAEEFADRDELVLAPDVVEALEAHVLARLGRAPSGALAGIALPELRSSTTRALRRLAALDRGSAANASAAIDGMVASLLARNRLVQEGDRIRTPESGPVISPDLAAAMDRLEAALTVAAPPDLAEAARAAGCPPEGVRALIAAGRIIRLEADLAWAAPTYQRLARLALDLAEKGALTPAALRDATGTSRRFVLAILEDLDRREILRRTPAGHIPGPRAPKPKAATPS
jgi:selenocysteine-specific elongation factor